MTRRQAAPIALGASLWMAGLGVWQFFPSLDVGLLGVIEATRDSGIARIAAGLTSLGDFRVLIPVTLLAATWLVIRADTRAAIWLLATTLAGRAGTTIEKNMFARERPPLVGRLVEAASPSFPSAHAFNTMLVGLAIIIALRGGRGALLLATAFALTIGASRLVLGVHWPSDVVAGWGSALAWVSLWKLANLPAARAEAP